MRSVVYQPYFELQLEALRTSSLVAQLDAIVEAAEWTLCRERLENYPEVGQLQGVPVRMLITVPLANVPSFTILFTANTNNEVYLLAIGMFPVVRAPYPALPGR
jgi:hypothetical protein